MPHVLVIADRELPWERTRELRDLSQSFAAFLGEPVEFAFVRPELIDLARLSIAPMTGDDPIEVLSPLRVQTEGMAAGDMLYTDDGRPDWGAMWESFCELAYFGGPAHRGPDSAIFAPSEGEATGTPSAIPAPVEGEFDPIAEIRRGIYMTTGLFSEPAEEPGWLAISCRSRQMAAWMCACIILENVDARLDDQDRLLVPAGTEFTLKDQVKSVVTVVAKVAHYWQMHAVVYGLDDGEGAEATAVAEEAEAGG
ncbi:MAG: hypothetical protein M0R75_10540 [Dehalococcoidia bacterium]|nr:hypothetical protein [Dehalococcoidia bacterium]